MIVIPFRWWFYPASCIGPFIIMRPQHHNVILLNHECIHARQQFEMGYVFAYALYILEFVCKLFYYRFNARTAYMSVSFEREAYLYEQTVGYLAKRKPYQHLRLIWLRDKKKLDTGAKVIDLRKIKK